MALVFVDNGESVALQYLVGKIASTEAVSLKLYTDNEALTDATVAGDLTEATGNGYADKDLTGASWTVTGTNPTSIGYAEQTFTFSGALGNVYGYYFVRTSTLDLLWAETFSDGPYNIANNGDQIKITPAITIT